MDFAPKAGCPMCGIVASAQHGALGSPRSPSFPEGSTAPEVLWRDDNFTVYREKANPVSTKGHLVIAFNLHVPSIYALSSTDIPLLTTIKQLSVRLLGNLAATPSSPGARQLALGSPTFSSPQSLPEGTKYHVGFITPPFKDNKIPVTDHLHAHAYLEPMDNIGWWRGVAYSSVAWYAIDDLIAEIRESTSNNRVKSGYQDRKNAPIDQVPQAGARNGTAFGIETTEAGIASADLEAADGPTPHTPSGLRSRSPGPSRTNTLSPPVLSPSGRASPLQL